MYFVSFRHPDYRIYERAAPEVQYQAPAERGYYRGRQEDIIVLD